MIIALLEVKDNKLNVQARLYRSGHEITPDDVIEVAKTLPKFIKQAVREGTKK